MTEARPGDRIGPYQVESILQGHRGGFAQLLLAQRPARDGGWDRVVIKLARTEDTDPADAEAFSRALSNEVETLRQLKHPGIVRLYPIEVSPGRFSYVARAVNIAYNPWYFVMEYLSGGSLDDLIGRNHGLPPTLVVELAHQVGEALDYIHTSGYAHLDIKTTNILLRRPIAPQEPPEAVLIDFGAAQKALRRAEVEAGALVYLSPERVEVLTGRRPPESFTTKGAADVYALGITLFKMLTGGLPFGGKRGHITTAILTEAPTQPQELNPGLVGYPELSALVLQMLEKRPERRPSIREVLTRLDQIMPPPRVGAIPATVATKAPNRWRLAAAALGAIAAVELAALAFAPDIRSLLPFGSPEAAAPNTVSEDSAQPTSAEAAPAPTDAPVPTALAIEAATETPVTDASAPAGGGVSVTAPEGDAALPPEESSSDTGPPTLVPTRTPAPTRTPIPPTNTPLATP